MIDRVNLESLCYKVIRQLDSQTVRKLEYEDGPDTTDVVRNVIRTDTPLWVFYHIQQHSDSLVQPANQIYHIIPTENFIEKATKYANRESGSIDLTSPVSQEWNSDDPKSNVREAFQNRIESIRLALQSMLDEKTELSDQKTERLSEDITSQVDPLQWELNRIKQGGNEKASDIYISRLYLLTVLDQDSLPSEIELNLKDHQEELQPLEFYRTN